MTTLGEPRVWLEQFPLGEPQAFAVDYHGLRYCGEIIRSERWNPAWGEALTEDLHFRIVLLLRQTVASFPVITDSRIALCLPGPGEYRQRDQLLSEMATIRETQALYLTQRDPESDLIRRALQRHQQDLEDRLMAQEVSRYSSGTIQYGPDHRIIPSDLITGSDPVAWFSRIASWLLAQSYPDLPVDTDVLPRVVMPEDPGLLFRDIFQPAGDSTTVLAELGPGLGLSTANRAEVYDPSSCSVLGIIQRQLSEMPCPASWPELHHYLSHHIGLTGPLATLYLLLFLDQQRPDWEVRLARDHKLVLAGGLPLPGTRLTRDLLPALEWSARLSQRAITIGPATEPHWNDTLVYLQALGPDLSEVEREANIPPQEQQLLQALQRISQQVARGLEFLSVISRRDGQEVNTAVGLSQALGRLSGVSGDDFRSIYRSIRNTYDNYQLLEQDVELLAQVSHLASASEEISRAWQYTDAALVPSRLVDLSIEKQAVEASLAPDSLLRFSRSWSNLAQQVADFQSHFAAAYQLHHEQIQRSLPGFRRDLVSAGLKARALELLNAIPELGPPVGESLAESLGALDVVIPFCPTAASDLDLSATPSCPFCGLSLDQTLPVEDLNGLLAAIDTALGEKNRHLSNLLVERILQGRMDQRLEDFLKIVQASDLSALSNTISAELVGFIREMLG